MKPEPAGASEAKRMMIGPLALACGADTAPGNKNALAARRKIKVERVLVMFLSIRANDGIAKLPNGTILDIAKGKNDER
ncbi:MAG: hypothetical protein WBM96_16705 [Polyangiales bacterium]